MQRSSVKVAIVHDWLVRYRGGEKVLEAICELYPDADLFTLIHRPGSIPPALERHQIHTTFLQRFPGVHRRYRHLLPLFPSAVGSFDLSGYQLTFASLPLDGLGRGGYFLWVGAPAAYKRLDVAMKAFASLNLPLWIAGFEVGSGGDSRSLAPNIRLLGEVSDGDLATLYRDARAVVFTAEEDFGIVPLEAQSMGRPVIAFGAGGALETVDARTGIFYSPHTPDALAPAVKRF